MKATLTILGAAFAMMLLVGCGAEDASYVRAEGELSGRWAIRAIEQSHGCPDLGPLSPVEQGLTEIQMTETGVELLGRNARLPVAYQVDGRVWSRKTGIARYMPMPVGFSMRWARPDSRRRSR